jgi:hypothetical protein
MNHLFLERSICRHANLHIVCRDVPQKQQYDSTIPNQAGTGRLATIAVKKNKNKGMEGEH